MDTVIRKTVVENKTTYTKVLQCSCNDCQYCNRKCSIKVKSEWKIVESRTVTVETKTYWRISDCV